MTGNGMTTVRVNICYRPLRICWAIARNDLAAFRKAVKLNHTMWGGRYNPVAVVDRTEEAVDIVEAYRPDVVVPIGDSETVKAFPKRFPHLISPFFHDELFVGQGGSDARAQVLDIHNLLVHVNDKPAWTELKNKGLRQYQWDATDALTDIFLIHLGQYPDVADTGIDYRGLLVQVGDAAEVSIDAATPIPENTFEYLTVSSLPRYGLERHYMSAPIEF